MEITLHNYSQTQEPNQSARGALQAWECLGLLPPLGYGQSRRPLGRIRAPKCREEEEIAASCTTGVEHGHSQCLLES